MKSKEVCMIHNRETGDSVGSYSRACRDVFEFDSVSSARNANCHDMFQDKEKYKINRYKVTYELIEEDAE